MLNAHRSITVPHPPHIMKLFAPLESKYGNPEIDANFLRLVTDVCRMVELHTYQWEIKPDPGLLFRSVRERNLLNIYFEIYGQYLAHTGKRRWCCKSTFMIEHIAGILRYYPGARFIFMVRDGRDVAVSARKSIFNHYHIFYTASRWQREQRIGLDWLSRLPQEQIILLRYEELIADTGRVVRDLCRFLDETFEPQMLEYHRSGEARKSGSLSVSWENTSKPVIRENSNKYRRQLTPHEILQFETIAFREMQELGYQPDNLAELLLQNKGDLMREHFSYRLAEVWMKIKVESSHFIKDRNSVARLRKNLYMFYIRNFGWRGAADV
ncbi:MAG: sulfotransferase [Desulfuromonadaceae bacterium]|nr:sulfotransferase [Desulfuromonadaceae bacterium]MDD2854339.1 sulfotransferase [Desulfuromonadaceae bacterium]